SRGPKATNRAQSTLVDRSEPFPRLAMSPQELQVQQKRALEAKQEPTVSARTYIPGADIFEAEAALSVVLEMPGVDKSNVDVSVEGGVLVVEGRVDFSKYEGMHPVYTEYNV